MFALIKFGKSKHILDMFNNEYLYFKELSKFRSDNKDINGRLDPKEGNLSSKQLNYLEIKVNDKIFKISDMAIEFIAQFPQSIPGNICSFYCLFYEDGNRKIYVDDRMLELGDKAILIFNLDKFFKIIDNGLSQKQIKYSRRQVQYYDPKIYDGDLSFHHKTNDFSFQQEYRIFLDTNGNTPIKINVHGFKDCSMVFDSREMKEIEINEIK